MTDKPKKSINAKSVGAPRKPWDQRKYRASVSINKVTEDAILKEYDTLGDCLEEVAAKLKKPKTNEKK